MAHRTDLTVPVATHTTVQLPAAVRSHGTVPGSLPPSSTHLARGSLRRYGGTGTGRYGARLTSAAAVRCHGTGTVPGSPPPPSTRSGSPRKSTGQACRTRRREPATYALRLDLAVRRRLRAARVDEALSLLVAADRAVFLQGTVPGSPPPPSTRSGSPRKSTGQACRTRRRGAGYLRATPRSRSPSSAARSTRR